MHGGNKMVKVFDTFEPMTVMEMSEKYPDNWFLYADDLEKKRPVLIAIADTDDELISICDFNTTYGLSYDKYHYCTCSYPLNSVPDTIMRVGEAIYEFN